MRGAHHRRWTLSRDPKSPLTEGSSAATVGSKYMRSRSWIWGALVIVGTSRAWGAEPGPSEEAKRAFAAGGIPLKNPDGAQYEDTLTQFTQAYRPFKRWEVLRHIRVWP